MRKFLVTLSSIILVVPTLTVSACSFDFIYDLNTLPNYNWSREEPYFNSYPQVNSITSTINDSGTLNYSNNQHVIDYKDFNTGYKNRKSLVKQAVTGVPINSAFLPNGNFLSDFGVNDKSLIFQRVNTILDWNPSIDKDAKYNRSDYPLVKSTKVASNWVHSQDPSVKTTLMGLAVKHTSGMSTVVGKNRIFNYNFNNWQYVNNFVAWAGSASEGIIVPPAADDIDAAHENGAKIYGQIFLDGFHGLTKSMLQDFLIRDKNGRFLIVDILIYMAVYMGFDGWFYNNEPNGSLPEGTVMDSELSVKIIQQFYSAIKKSKNPLVQNLAIIPYKNASNLYYYKQINQPSSVIEDQFAQATRGTVVQDFGSYPNDSLTWSKMHPEYNSYDIYNMSNTGGWIDSQIFYNKQRIGTNDFRDLTQLHLDPNGNYYTDPIQEAKDMAANKWTFSGQNINSISLFQSTTPFDLADMYLNSLPKNMNEKQKLNNDLYATVYGNYYDDMLYTGRHRFLSNDDKGSTSLNPNFDVSNMSYGVGDLYLENTVLFDSDNGYKDNINHFKTNFSTGQGQYFVDQQGNKIGYKLPLGYPWDNRRLEDVQPTYKWDIKEANSSGNFNNSDAVQGFYDYYNPYRKGNSIALGSSFNSNKDGKIEDNNGKINPFTLKNKIDWNIMGTNYSGFNKTVKIVYRIADQNGQVKNSLNSNIGVRILITFADGTTTTLGDSTKQLTGKDVGWYQVQGNLQDLSDNFHGKTIAKIGLSIDPNSDAVGSNILFDVGQITVDNNDSLISKTNHSLAPIQQLNNEYTIFRKNQGYDLRINFSINQKLKDQISYYEFYLEKNNGRQSNFYYLGMTPSNLYYLKNLDIGKGDKYKLIIKTNYHDRSSYFQAWNLQLNNN